MIAAALQIAAGFKEAAFWLEEIINVFTREKKGILYNPETGFNIGGGYSQMMADSAVNPLSGIFKAINGLDLTNKDKFLGLSIPRFNSGNTPVVVQVSADAERMGLTVSQTGAMKDAISEETRRIQN